MVKLFIEYVIYFNTNYYDPTENSCKEKLSQKLWFSLLVISSLTAIKVGGNWH